jgi:hypothetical protein
LGLAVLVVQIGYDEDLAWFYLGRAAEGLGSDKAALKYYKISAALATRRVRNCDRLPFNTCDGHKLPQEANDSIAALKVWQTAPVL